MVRFFCAAMLVCPGLSPALSLAAGAPGTSVSRCSAAYKEDYEAVWNLGRASWERRCRRGAAPHEILRRVQGGFMKRCAKRFSGRVKKGDIIPFKVSALCARGIPGERELAGILGEPAPRAPRRPEPRTRDRERNAGIELYDLVLSNGRKLPKKLTGGEDLVEGQTYKMMQRTGVTAFVPVDVPEAKCFLRIETGAQLVSEAHLAGFNTPKRLWDRGCSGLLASVSMRWDEDALGWSKPERFTQKELDILFEIVRDVLSQPHRAVGRDR